MQWTEFPFSTIDPIIYVSFRVEFHFTGAEPHDAMDSVQIIMPLLALR